MNNKTCLLFYLIILSNSCSFNGSFQGLYSYYEKTLSTSPHLFAKTEIKTSICDSQKRERYIYIINGSELKKCLENIDKSIIYIWTPRCKSSICYDLNMLQHKCNALNIELFVVAEYYDAELMNLEYTLQKPIFGIDTKYYKTDLTSKYLKMFIYDLTLQKDKGGRVFYFHKDQLIKNTDRLEILD